MPRRAKRTVGLSISSQAIAVAQIHMTGSGMIAVDSLGVSEMQPDVIGDAGIIDSNAISEAIQNLLADNNIRYRDMALSISGNSVVTRLLTLPTMPGNEMLEVIKGEVENYAVLAGEESVLDFHIVEQRNEDAQQKMEVLVLAITEELLNSYNSTVKMASFNTSAVETIPLAILRIPTDHGSGNQTQNTKMVVCIEKGSGAIMAVQNKTIRFIHSVEGESERLSEDPSTLGELADELRSSLSYYQTTFPSAERIEEIILFMDGANNVHICDGLGKLLNMPVIVGGNASPLLEMADAHIQDRAMDYGLSSYAAIGTAARAMVGDDDVNIDLLHPKRFKTSNLKNAVFKALLCLISITLLSIYANIFLNAKASSIKNRMLSTWQSEGSSEPRLPQILSETSCMETDVRQLETQIHVNKAITDSNRRMNWAGILIEISSIIPKTMWLSNLSWRDSRDARLSGFALSYDSVFGFRDKLMDSPHFDSVRLVSVRNGKLEVHSFIEFEIHCRIRQNETQSE